MKLSIFKRILTLLVLSPAMLSPECADAQKVKDIRVDSVSIRRHGDYLAVDFCYDLARVKVPSNRAVVLTPRLVNGNDSVDLKSVGIYGRRRYYYYMRNGGGNITGPEEIAYRSKEQPADLPYHLLVPYSDWMNGAKLTLYRDEYGCCRKLEKENMIDLATFFMPEPFVPKMIYIRPKAEKQKARSLSGQAYIDFPVDKTVIYPDYRRNTVELRKIRATIDSVRADKDIKITKIWLKGYASPESPYSHNRDLAIGRTNALKRYISGLYSLRGDQIDTDYEPEDWDGLRRKVESSSLPNKYAILDLIDSNLDPDVKEARIKTRFPEDYRFMLRNWYPALRHTDYRINYDIRSYSDINEIKKIFAESPQKLSLGEFYLLAGEYKPGSPEFNDVFETAVRMYPNDEVANLNAANSEIESGNFKAAERFLLKAGHSPEATYARGILAFRQENYPEAQTYLRQAQKEGVKEADEILEEISKIIHSMR